jgi:hypothetical protein
MIRRFNYTGRKKIPRSKVSIFLNEGPGKTLAFDASVDFEGLPVPPSANIFIEAHRRHYFKRFSCGTVSAPKFPRGRILEGLDSNALVRFRVKAVDKKGRIVAAADNIQPKRIEEEEADRLCLLPVDFADLGHAIWRLDLENDWPILQLNKNIEEMREVARSDHSFLALVYPEVLRQIFFKIIVEEDHTDPETDPDDWMSGWLRYAVDLLGKKQMPSSGQSEPIKQEKLKWIEDVVEAFCSNNQILEKFAKFQKGGES